MAGYTRQSLAEIQDGEDIIAAPLNNEFDAIQEAFDAVTGHTHDGTVGNGPLIDLTASVNGVLPIANGGTNKNTIAADKIWYSSSLNTLSETSITAFARTLIDDADATTARATLGLVIGTNVQAYDAGLQSISGLTTAADKMIYTTALDTYAVTDLTSFARTLLDDGDAATARATLGVSIGSQVQAYDAGLESIAGLTTAADRMIYTTASDTYAVTTLTSFARTLLDDTSAATARSTLGLVTIASTGSASDLTSGTLPDARLSGSYSGIVSLTQTGIHTITLAGEALRLNGPLSTDDPYMTFYAGGARTAYIQHTDGTGTGAGFRFFNDVTDDYLYLSNVNNVDALKFFDSSVGTHNTVWHSGNLAASDINTLYGYTPASNAITMTAGNGMTGGGNLTASRTFTLGTPSNITNSTTNSVTSTSHTHALGFTAAEVYTGSDVNYTSFPIGSVVLAQSSDPDRNESLTVRLSTGTVRFNTSSGTALSGTWRARGNEDQSGSRATLFQRTA